MRIISIRKGFQADHSSTSYEFLAVDKKLDAKQRRAVAKLSSRADPTNRRVSFVYNSEWHDLPGGWEPLMTTYYDVMYSESYDWWTLAMAFNASENLVKRLNDYEFDGIDDMGVRVAEDNGRVVVSISCRLDPDPEYFGGGERSRYYEDYYDEDEEADADDEDDFTTSDDSFLDLLSENRTLLMKGDYRLLQGVWERYGDENECPQNAQSMNDLPKPIANLVAMLADE